MRGAHFSCSNLLSMSFKSPSMCAESFTFSTPANMVKEKRASEMKTHSSICPAKVAKAATATTPTLATLMAQR